MRRLVSALAGATLLVAGLAAVDGAAIAATTAPDRSATPSPAARAYHPPKIDWGRCDSSSLRAAKAKCGMLVVPLDYAKPKGTRIRLAVSRIAHTTPDRKAQGPMLVNPGGPGGSGLQYSLMKSWLPPNVGSAYDWVGFDPRGVGSSRPSLSCDGDVAAAGRPTYVPETPQIADYWEDKAAGYAAACKKANLALLKHTDTRTWVQDMESLRMALGAKKINFYGFSYGTYLGSVYATQYPNRVRRFVLDGVVNPSDVWYDANLEQNKQFDLNIDTFFDWVADHDDAYGLGTDGDAVRDIYYDVLDELAADPDADFGAADWNDVFVGAAYYVYGWDETAHILVAAANGDLGPARDSYGDPTGPGADNTYANYLAVQCTDAPWPKSWNVWKDDAETLHETAPFLTWNNTWYNAPCRTWTAPAHKPAAVNGRSAPPILLIAETEDAATPFAGALEVRHRFPKSVLIEGVGGTTHSGSLSGVACTDDKIARYLLSGKLPQRQPGNGSDVQCDPVPPPSATSSDQPANRLDRLREQLMRIQLLQG